MKYITAICPTCGNTSTVKLCGISRTVTCRFCKKPFVVVERRNKKNKAYIAVEELEV